MFAISSKMLFIIKPRDIIAIRKRVYWKSLLILVVFGESGNLIKQLRLYTMYSMNNKI